MVQLTMSKLDSKLLAVTPITVDPLQIAKESLKMFEVEARRVDIDLRMKVDKSTPIKATELAANDSDSLGTEASAEVPKIEGILVVEDNLINQQITRRGLADHGFTVDVANHGVEALEKLRASDRWLGEGPITVSASNGSATADPSSAALATPTTPTRSNVRGPDTTLNPAITVDLTPTTTPNKFPLSLILMDMEMPVQDGLTCTRHIRELERQGKILGGSIPIIAVSANARLEQVLEAKAAGCDDVMIKPYRMPELIEKMKIVAMQAEQKNRNPIVDMSEAVEIVDSTSAGGPGPPEAAQ
ncbi:putative histidine kinase group protein [Diaporthe ampelina]|uniref:Putative histidine kinase group protein n=1 Tax=Diaporthe ampelina TaxID=1214573 RepID=A0A0G2FCN0_9PEZI|nr:putative histidine kinase group protein [Diaporthe ampelina]